ncbi:UDP-N-acetylmuramate dehydrogenase [Puniceibacterium sp. IMCC21224]|uniref:UDP-N-acetylmuramate dehydrogenase n=1 Tax=Puniceibacterium sp. IMCC21224 TaxID=1618204 RepID=UPI00064DC859|nr:UDP-N-acetylmuramate dehydrogenase [Puniceibacterium sp. IMCC21224]KMK63827.1 UDP-N-acetylmuramate dehydrogenase [Puniceibacterium sp. IMCC21224]
MARDALLDAFPEASMQNVSLARISRWRIGGLADIVLRPRSVEELCAMRAYLLAQGLPNVVIGATSNLLFADAGLRAVALQIGNSLGKSAVKVTGTDITAGAGVWVPGLARRVMQAGLGGIEHICGIPGTFGGLVCMNGGSLRRGIGENITHVDSVDVTGALYRRDREACGFAYRRSVFQGNDEIVVSAGLALEAGEREAIRRVMLTILGNRRRKFPHHTPNCGSVFVSNPGMYADYGPPGAVIEKLGFKGRRIGDAQVSPEHANFIVNTGRARAEDVLALITGIKTAARRETGYDMEVEARYVRPDGTLVPADCAA